MSDIYGQHQELSQSSGNALYDMQPEQCQSERLSGLQIRHARSQWGQMGVCGLRTEIYHEATACSRQVVEQFKLPYTGLTASPA
jgi:hypothetical protein